MIIDRLGQQLREQNWVAVALEFLIVVAGVFVATQVSNWNAERSTQRRATAVSTRLTSDLRYEAWSYMYLVEYHRDVLANARIAVATLAGDTTVSDEELVIAAYRATQYKHQERHRATYDELVSTGEISLIKDDQLRTAAIDVFTFPIFDIIREEGRNSDYRRVFRRIVSAPVQHALLKACGDRLPRTGDYDAIVGSLAYPCTPDVHPQRISAAAAALRADPEVLPALRQRFADLETTVTDLTQNFNSLPELERLAKQDR